MIRLIVAVLISNCTVKTFHESVLQFKFEFLFFYDTGNEILNNISCHLEHFFLKLTFLSFFGRLIDIGIGYCLGVEISPGIGFGTDLDVGLVLEIVFLLVSMLEWVFEFVLPLVFLLQSIFKSTLVLFLILNLQSFLWCCFYFWSMNSEMIQFFFMLQLVLNINLLHYL